MASEFETLNKKELDEIARGLTPPGQQPVSMDKFNASFGNLSQLEFNAFYQSFTTELGKHPAPNNETSRDWQIRMQSIVQTATQAAKGQTATDPKAQDQTVTNIHDGVGSINPGAVPPKKPDDIKATDIETDLQKYMGLNDEAAKIQLHDSLILHNGADNMDPSARAALRDHFAKATENGKNPLTDDQFNEGVQIAKDHGATVPQIEVLKDARRQQLIRDNATMMGIKPGDARYDQFHSQFKDTSLDSLSEIHKAFLKHTPNGKVEEIKQPGQLKGAVDDANKALDTIHNTDPESPYPTPDANATRLDKEALAKAQKVAQLPAQPTTPAPSAAPQPATTPGAQPIPVQKPVELSGEAKDVSKYLGIDASNPKNEGAMQKINAELNAMSPEARKAYVGKVREAYEHQNGDKEAETKPLTGEARDKALADAKEAALKAEKDPKKAKEVGDHADNIKKAADNPEGVKLEPDQPKPGDTPQAATPKPKAGPKHTSTPHSKTNGSDDYMQHGPADPQTEALNAKELARIKHDYPQLTGAPTPLVPSPRTGTSTTGSRDTHAIKSTPTPATEHTSPALMGPNPGGTNRVESFGGTHWVPNQGWVDPAGKPTKEPFAYMQTRDMHTPNG